jgi:hypothetical protein
MRRRLAAVLVVATACAGRNVPTPEALAGTIPDGNYPVEAWLSQTRTSDLAFTVNQPAYVAIFYIAPGRGVSMLYPRYDDELDRTAAGFNVPGYRYDPGRWYFTNTTFSRLGEGPSYLYLIASREPLMVERYDRNPGLLRRALGLATFASYDEWAVMDELANLVVPPQPDDAWSTDLIVLWPPVPASRHASAFDQGFTRFVRCDNGRLLVVPRGYPYDACPFYSTEPPPIVGRPDSTTTPPDSTPPPDSTGSSPRPRPTPPERPTGRPVAPPAEGDSGRLLPTSRPARPVAGHGSGASTRALRDPADAPGRRVRDAYPDRPREAPGTRAASMRWNGDDWRSAGRSGGVRPAPSPSPQGERPAATRVERTSPPARVERPAPRAPERQPERQTERPAAERPSTERPSTERPADKPRG